MIGYIDSEQKCPICKSGFQDNLRDGLVCPNHPECRATRFRVKFGRKVCKRFKRYEPAYRFLNGLRYKKDEGTFDHRDYKKDNPFGFENLALKYLKVKEREVKRKSYNNLANYLNRAIIVWGNSNIKTLGYAEIEDFLLTQKTKFGEFVSDKTRSNMCSALHDFWKWLKKRRIITVQQFPDFPEVSLQLGWRKIVDKETQEDIIDEVYRISHHINIKVWLGIKWLSTYISMRPGEMLGLKESDIDTKIGALIIPHPKEKEPKLIYLLDEDIELIESIPRGMPHLPFFRHEKGVSGVTPGEKFGDRYLWKWWKKACANLRIEGVDLYGGTRHSTTTALSKVMSKEEIKGGSLHKTNKAFERYMQSKSADAMKVYKKASELTGKKARIIKLKKTANEN
ncbi:MAG: hypothetical protein HOD17_03940 [Desulfobacteraceae bacterium]|nr:hypothetical protein [Desulfobacteraceae bacterium]